MSNIKEMYEELRPGVRFVISASIGAATGGAYNLIMRYAPMKIKTATLVVTSMIGVMAISDALDDTIGDSTMEKLDEHYEYKDGWKDYFEKLWNGKPTAVK